ncbi:NAD-dependent epimerase/dehydratase family protein [Martelella sp. FLE1502]
MKECILVTGGAGFIGSALSKFLVEDRQSVVALDSFLDQVHPSGIPSEFLHPDVILLKRDVTERDTWESFLDEYDPKTVVHLAAETGTAQSLTESVRHSRVNVLGTSEMLDAFSRRGRKPDRIVLASSRAVYGEGVWRDRESGRTFLPSPRSHAQLAAGKWDPLSPNQGQVEALRHHAATVPANPTSIYGATKLTQEHILKAWCGAFGVPLAILRLQNVYGEGQSPHNSYTGIINIFHKLAHSKQAIPVYEDGQIVRDFVHIDDVVRAILASLGGAADDRGAIDVGSGLATSILDAARIIAEMHGAPEPVICGKFRDGDVRSACADISELVSLGVVPSVDFEEGSRRVGQWLVTQRHI